MLKEGIEFCNAKPEVVTDFLKSRSVEKIEVNPANLKVINSGELLTLQLMDGMIKEFPIRRTFLYKLLKWFLFPVRQLNRLSSESVVSICNDYLLNIKRDYVIVKIENGDVLSIVSPDYNEITDLEIIAMLANTGVRTISRNDYFLRVTTQDKIKTEPVPGDTCGIGLSIINSETGFRSLSVSHFILRYTCSNGAVVRVMEEKDFTYHYGNLDLKSFLNDRIEKAITERENIIQKLKLLNERNIEKEKKYYLSKIESVLGKREAAIFLQSFNQNLTQYELFNIISDRAKRYDLSKRHFLESVAGDLILN